MICHCLAGTLALAAPTCGHMFQKEQKGAGMKNIRLSVGFSSIRCNTCLLFLELCTTEWNFISVHPIQPHVAHIKRNQMMGTSVNLKSATKMSVILVELDPLL